MKDVTSSGRSLGSVLRSGFLKTALIPILTVELVLLGLYFLSTNYITDKNLVLLRSNALEAISKITRAEAKSFDDQLGEIRRNNLSLQTDHSTMFGRAPPDFKYKDKFFFEKVGYELGQNLSPTGYADLFLASSTKLAPSIRRKIIKTRDMGIRFKTLVENNPNLVTAYFNSWDNVTRIYPPMYGFDKQSAIDFDITKLNFYYLADKEHNPGRKPIWTKAYLDPAGRGWMLSSLVPIYQNNFLEGVTGLDVTLSTFSKHILSNRLQWNSGALVMDKDGHILTLSRAAESYLGLGDISDYNYKDNPVDRTQTQPTKYNLLKQNSMTGMYFSEFFNSTEKSMEFSLNGKEYLVAKEIIPETGWKLFILTPLVNVYGPLIAEKAQLNRLGLTFLLLAAIYYFLYFAYIIRSSKALANSIALPVSQVTRMIMSHDSDDKTYAVRHPVNISELDDLLSMNFKIQNSKIRYQQISEELKVKNEQLKRLAVTDQLTQLYNRLKLDEVLCYELARSQRDKTPLSVAIIDIDKFKMVNDTFGHQAGDLVLIGVSKIMLKNIRSTDILGRWGGEEFMLILPNTPLKSAFEHANKLRKLIAESSFNPAKEITISIGLAGVTDFVSEKKLIELADNALYVAKESGRNRVELALRCG